MDTSGPVVEVNGGADALIELERGRWRMLFVDRRLPDLDADELIQIIKARFPGIEVVLLDSTSANLPNPPTKISARYDSWMKPAMVHAPQPDRPEKAISMEPLPGMIGTSDPMRRLYRLARLVAPRNTTVLVQGATGTGKELVARAIHQLSPRSAGPWVVVNCAAIPETLLESELFGYTRGAFTGAVQSYVGRIQSAQGGTLFLDEVGELPLSLQSKLLRFLEQKEVQRLGSSDAVRVDVRVVAATNADLSGQVEEGRFRRDLFYRLSAFPLELPALAERGDDIRVLAEHFLRSQAAARLPALGPDALRRLRENPWPGNVRELAQVIERALILAEGQCEILPEHLYILPVQRMSSGVENSAQRRVV
ncbi:MAG TPA: sigma-54 dependent transcriptional regulator [Terriglobales bacterium]|nr:sigma-54 dependent transcriptional regulator [Terriglobales bacterium]